MSLFCELIRLMWFGSIGAVVFWQLAITIESFVKPDPTRNYVAELLQVTYLLAGVIMLFVFGGNLLSQLEVFSCG